VGLHDRFAEMELDSLDIMLLNLLMNDSFSLEISLDDMTHYPSIDNLAHFIWQQSAVGQAHPDANEIPNNHEPKTASVNLIPNQNEFAYSGE
ncbi:acyl carrier protein, partial [Klebsiella pneumoniae]|uniref:acyl carrier protein n=1 Tax=Klebsiella pneumoniae TaxID=573 RepID=UPI00273073DC